MGCEVQSAAAIALQITIVVFPKVALACFRHVAEPVGARRECLIAIDSLTLPR